MKPCGVRNAYVEFDDFLTHTVQMKQNFFRDQDRYGRSLLNPHGSDETRTSYFIYQEILYFLTHTVQMKLNKI